MTKCAIFAHLEAEYVNHTQAELASGPILRLAGTDVLADQCALSLARHFLVLTPGGAETECDGRVASVPTTISIRRYAKSHSEWAASSWYPNCRIRSGVAI